MEESPETKQSNETLLTADLCPSAFSRIACLLAARFNARAAISSSVVFGADSTTETEGAADDGLPSSAFTELVSLGGSVVGVGAGAVTALVVVVPFGIAVFPAVFDCSATICVGALSVPGTSEVVENSVKVGADMMIVREEVVKDERMGWMERNEGRLIRFENGRRKARDDGRKTSREETTGIASA